MRKHAKKTCSLVLALAMALCCLPAAFATENAITIDFGYYDGGVVIPKGELTVYDGIAEKYGYTLREDAGITVFDALVAAHKAYYGEAFTAETAGDYLVMSNGFITTAFTVASASLGFFVNDEMPNDGIFNEGYNSYTGYACDQAIIAEGDYISFFTYKDPMWSDYYMVVSDSEIEVFKGEEFTVSAEGYSAMWYGCYREEDRAAYTYPMAGIKVYSTTDFEKYDEIGVLDENGEITLSFDEAGTVYLCMEGTFADPYMGSIPVVANWVEVTVSEPKPEPDPEPIYEDVIYIPCGFNLDIDADSETGKVSIEMVIEFFDIKGEAPAKTEKFGTQFNAGMFIVIFQFIAGVL